MDQLLGENECEKLTHSQQQQQALKTHKKKPTIRLTTRVTIIWAPQRSGSWSWMKSSARQTQESTSSTQRA